MYIYICKVVIYFKLSVIPSNFLGGAEFSMSIARRKTVVQLGSLGPL